VTCACGNAARYVAADGRLTCALCPLRDGVDSVRLSDVPALLALARRFLDATRSLSWLSIPKLDAVDAVAGEMRALLGRPPG
jgi:hypothetical protein